MRILHRSPSLAGRVGQPHRPAFTLVEMIVAIAIISVLAGLAVLILPQLQDTQRVTKGADVVQGQLFIAKMMALRDRQPRGVRLIKGANGFTSLQLIEQPPPYSTGSVTNVGAADATGWYPVTITLPTGTSLGNNTVQVGDLLDLTPANDTYCMPTPSGSPAMHYIKKVATGNPATVWVLTQPQVNALQTPPPWAYSIVRSPRPLTGESPVKMPTDVVVDWSNTPLTGDPSGKSIIPGDSDNNYEILFDPSGRVLRAAGNQGKVILWVYDPNGATPGDTLVAVYSYTGIIGAQPVAPGADPYAFVKDGVSSGM